jgi:hypothetical protein
MQKILRAFLIAALFSLTLFSKALCSTDNRPLYHGLRIVPPQEAAAIKAGGVPIICPGRICEDIATTPCASAYISDACQGVTCVYKEWRETVGTVSIYIQRCEVNINQEVCEDQTEKNYTCTESHAVDSDLCQMDGFDSHCGWKLINTCYPPKPDANGVWGCPDGCYSIRDVGDYCGEGCFPFLL